MAWSAETAMPSITQGLFGRLRREAGAEWDAYIDHPFVRGLADGTLEPERFKRYLVQDYLYLLQYARCYALAIYKSDTLEGMRTASGIVAGLLLGELTIHVSYCAQWGLDEAALQAEPQSLELLAYSGFLLDRAQAGDLLDLMVVLSACLVGYGEIGSRIAADPATKRDGNPYYAWIQTYSGSAYHDLVGDGLARLEALGATRGAADRFPLLLRDFRTAVRLETAFWDAGSR